MASFCGEGICAGVLQPDSPCAHDLGARRQKLQLQPPPLASQPLRGTGWKRPLGTYVPTTRLLQQSQASPGKQHSHPRYSRIVPGRLVPLLDARLEDAVIERTFNTYWPQFEKEFARALEINPPSEDVPERTSEDIMGEILNNIRMANNRIRRLENNLSRGDTVGAQLLEEMLNIDGLEGSDVDKIAGYFSASDFEKIKRLRSGINKKG